VTAPFHLARRRQQVERAAQEWRSALIDVSGANRLLYFRPTASTLDLDAADPGARADLLDGSTVRLSRLFPAPAAAAAAQRAVKALHRKQREAAEEYGVSVAFCAWGLATWALTPDHQPGAAGRLEEEVDDEPGGPARRRPAAGRKPQPPAAPVLLRAVELTHRPGSVDTWELKLVGEVQPNPVLLHVLAGEGVRLVEEEVLDLLDDPRGHLAVYEHLAAAAAAVAGFEIAERTVLGAFSYLKQPMVADCEDIGALVASDLVSALAGDEEAVARVRTPTGEVRESDPDYRPVETELLVLDADASQSFVVNAALAGRNLVVEGPPGTGKSQTIGNVIAGLVAEGKRVLFVAQKRAAITAVLDRLEAVGLGALTLDLFAAGASRRYVAEQLGDVLDRQAAVGAPVTGGLHLSLTSARDRLVRHRDALHTRRHAWGVTVADLLALTRTVPADAATELRLLPATLAAWGPDDLQRLAEAVGELAAKGGLERDRTTRPGWSVAVLTTTERVAAANDALVRVGGGAVDAAADAVAQVTAELGIGAPVEPGAVTAFLTGLAECAAVAQSIPGGVDPGLDDPGLERLLVATDRAYRKSSTTRLGLLERRRARRAAYGALAPHVAALSPGAPAVHALLQRAKVCRAWWRHLGARGPVRGPAALTSAQAAVGWLWQGLAGLQPYLQNVELHRVSLDALPGVLAGLRGDRGRAELPRVHELEALLHAADVGPVLAALRRRAAQVPESARDGAAAADLLRHVAVHSAQDHALTTDPALAGIGSGQLRSSAEEFRRRDADHLEANVARVRRAAAVRLTRVLDELPVQHRFVKREITKKRNVKPVRALFHEAPDVLTALKPCWAMSPLQVSRLLPATPCFDVVIFDEASQVKPADAIPALLRAPQAVIAGDSRQLPPTEFFTKVLEDPADLPGTSETEALAAEAAGEDADLGVESTAAPPRPQPVGETYTRDAESVLFAVDRVLAGQSRRLQWHYRRRDERLIAVSSTWVYQGSLTTFPAADAIDCLRHVAVPSSPGIKGGANSPAAEVGRVVDLVREHARTRPAETLGVIAFGIPHTRRIEAALEDAFAAEPGLAQVLDGDEREPFFVKNIERVQGDERDAIILSVGYGTTADGRLKLFWGPLLRPGGERRLNVAISRARSRMTLVTSFEADDVAEDAHPSAGFALMYRFLRFMASDGTELSADGRRPTPLNAFELDIRDRLSEAGLDLLPQLGVGSYRLDFAVRHPEHPGRYVLAIEADGAMYHSGHTARERDRLRQQLLEARGWRFHRIWSTDWFTDADGEVARTVAVYEAAVAADDAARAEAAYEGEAAVGDPTVPPMPEPSWHVADNRRTVAPPPFVPGQPITQYSHHLLVRLVRHVRSDGVLRTRDDELAVLMRELGLTKRGHRIVAALSAAQAAA